MFKFSTSDQEIRHLVKSWVFISLAFGMVLGGFADIAQSFLIASLTVGIGFLVHEMGHKIVAQYYGCKAEFRSDGKMLWFALATSLFGIVFAAPGAVIIQTKISVEKMGRVALAGPIVNYCIALAFFVLISFVSEGMWGKIFSFGYVVNAWLGVFNMIPLFILDGKKVWDWDKRIYAVFFFLGLVIMNLNVIFT